MQNMSCARGTLHNNWQTSKENLNCDCNWESLAWRRHILGLAYFHHVYYCRYSLLQVHGFKKSGSSRRPHFLILPVAGSYISRSFLFMFAIAWNTLPEAIRCLNSPGKFKSAIRKHFAVYQHKVEGLKHVFI